MLDISHLTITSMNRSLQILSLFLFLTLASAVRAQAPLRCGIIGIDGSSEVDPGTSLVLKAKTTGIIHTTKPEFKWNVSAGTITAGQGTEEITVDTVGLGGREVTVTVELSGAPVGCQASATTTTQVKLLRFVCGLAFDQYGDIKFEDEKARLDNFAIQLMNYPQSSGSLLMSAGQETFKNETTERLSRAKSYLVNVRGVDPNRIVTLDCGFSRQLNIYLYVVPPGATFPACNNDVEVLLSEVKFTKRRPRSSKKRH